MALARGILLWLPLQQLLPGELLRPALISLRLAAVNGVSAEEFASFRSSLGDLTSLEAAYVRLCVQQGELCSEAVQIFRPQDLLYRALLLGQNQFYEEFIGRMDLKAFEENDWLLQNALESGQPHLQALTLAQYSLYQQMGSLPILEELRDLESIPWTPALYRYFVAQAREHDRVLRDASAISSTMGFTFGFFQIYSLPEILAKFGSEVLYSRSNMPPDTLPDNRSGTYPARAWLDMLRGWLVAELSKTTGPPPVFPELTGRFFFNPFFRRTIFSTGYLLPVGSDYDKEMMLCALAYLRPRALQELLRRGVPLPRAPTLDYGHSIVSRDLLRRAEQILQLCPPQTDSAYLTDVRALLGGEIGPMLGEDRLVEMLALANPSLWSRVDFQKIAASDHYDIPYILNNSNVKYDLRGAAGKITLGRTNFWQLLAYGQFYSFYRRGPTPRAELAVEPRLADPGSLARQTEVIEGQLRG